MPVSPKMQTGMHARVGAGSMSASRVGAGQRSLVRRFLHQANLPLILVVGLLTSYGLLVVNVAIVGSADYAFSKQLFGVGIGMVLLVLLWIFDYRKLAPFMIPLLIIDVILLLSPMIPGVGLSVNGARSWVVIFGQQFQPGEPAKIITIVYLAAMVSRYQGKINSGREYIKVLALSLIPVAGIMTQPDLGSGMVLFVIAMVILFTGGANRKWLLLTIAIIIAMIVSVLAFDSALDDYFGYDVLLKDYQKNRLLVFLDENLDPDGAGYNLKQAKIAIGSGGFMGKGIGNATQSGLGFLPEAPTDFIFCVLAETFGFVGSVALIVLYTALLLLTLRVAIMVNDRFGTLIATGTIGMWLFQIFENIGMDCGLMPITGIPLPFMSYGSSFMVVNFMALGLIFSIYRKRDEK